MMPFMIAMMVFGLLQGALDIKGAIVAAAIIVAPAIQVWLNPEAIIPRFYRDSAIYRRRVVVEWILSAQLGILIWWLSSVAGQYGRHLV